MAWTGGDEQRPEIPFRQCPQLLEEQSATAVDRGPGGLRGHHEDTGVWTASRCRRSAGGGREWWHRRGCEARCRTAAKRRIVSRGDASPSRPRRSTRLAAQRPHDDGYHSRLFRCRVADVRAGHRRCRARRRTDRLEDRTSTEAGGDVATRTTAPQPAQGHREPEGAPSEPLPFVGLRAQGERLRQRIEQRLGRVLDHGAYVNGPEIEERERSLADFVGGGVTCVACSSGTDALVMALLEMGIGAGDVVFVPSFTFTATAEVVLLVGATPWYVDVDEQTMNLCPCDLERQIARARESGGGRRLRAVMAVDLFGLPADYSALDEICAREGLELIADSAQSFGAAQGGRRVGALAGLTATSFFPAKPLGGYGDGGAVFVTDAARAETLRSIREHGKGPDRYDIVRLGINGRLDSFQAAVLLVKLEVFGEETSRREALSRAYDEGLSGLPLWLPARREGAESAWAQYTLQVDDRDALRVSLQRRGVPTAVYYPLPMHLQPAYRSDSHPEGSLPVSERLCGRVVSLPMHPYQAAADTERVIEAVRSHFAD
ncbi:MAG: DegT/DnrJ/EryC1/StrS family aminotransferase [Acidobacteria bacterium]|nr:MAG: DegT/DnrJ/EryC1/StrS family aminotransferase [Acidobacteriota bacterium]